MKPIKTFRNNGAIGALLDEYEKAIIELKHLIEVVSDFNLVEIVDKETKDLDCISIQSILNHVIRAGYNYVIEIRNSLGENLEFKQTRNEKTIAAYQVRLDEMFKYNVQLFEDYPSIQLEEYNH